MPSRRPIVISLGVVVSIAGLVMLVIPGPGLFVLLAGLAMLSTELPWVKNWIEDLLEKMPLSRRKKQKVESKLPNPE